MKLKIAGQQQEDIITFSLVEETGGSVCVDAQTPLGKYPLMRFAIDNGKITAFAIICPNPPKEYFNVVENGGIKTS